MSSTRLGLACVLFGFGFGCGSSNSPSIDASTAFTLEATDLVGGTFTAAQTFTGFGCTGQNASPALRWSNPPAGTKSFVLTMFDPDAPTGSGFWHWTMFDIPPATTSLAAKASATSGTAGTIPAGAIEGYTDFGRPGYGGPCPPTGDPAHRYVFQLSALNVDNLGLAAGAPGALVTFAARSMTIGTATFTANFGISPGTLTHPEPPTSAAFKLMSTELAAGTFANEQILNAFGCTGGNVSPSLTWSGAPAGTQSFVLTVHDPDAPTGSGFWHWLAFDIPAGATSIARGAGTPNAALVGGVQGYNDTGANAYAGPCPPPGDSPHHYKFTLYAMPVPSLATAVPLSAAAPGGFIGFVVHASPAKAIGQATFTATYGR